MTAPIGSFTVPDDHPALAGHFPGNPIVPGVVLLDELCALIEAATARAVAAIPAVRFARPVRGDETVTVHFAFPDFTATVDGAVTLRGTVALA